MVKDPKTGEILRTDHMIKEVLEARLKGDREARGQTLEHTPNPKAKQRKKASSVVEAIRLDDTIVQEYEEILAKVRN